MARLGFTPNGVSVLGLFFAGAGAGAMLLGAWWIAAACVQSRLLCNMLDGLIAVEQGKGDRLGGFFNEVPDRLEDLLLLLAAGYAAGGEWGAELGAAAAMLALGTAYLRQTGGAMGLAQDFCGPLAKPQRMFVLTLALVAAGSTADPQRSLGIGLGVIVVGTAVTVLRRTMRLVAALRA
jgi:phosphatidylglycerophosphate synthase